jgi:hypothetical protein
MSKLPPQPQSCNSTPHITEQEITRARVTLGVKTKVPAGNANVQVEKPQWQKRHADRDTLRRARARDYAERAFRAARWGRS